MDYEDLKQNTDHEDLKQTIEVEIQALGINLGSSLGALQGYLLVILILSIVALVHFW